MPSPRPGEVIAELVVEMALITQSRERVLTSLVVVSCKRVRPTDRKLFDPGHVVAKSVLHSDPKGFVKDAMDRPRVARDDVDAGKRRIACASVANAASSRKRPELTS